MTPYELDIVAKLFRVDENKLIGTVSVDKI